MTSTCSSRRKETDDPERGEKSTHSVLLSSCGGKGREEEAFYIFTLPFVAWL
jgi:pentatricopeptide repeat protein